MHLIRRSAFRAIASPSASFIKTRSITTQSPFLLRSKPQATLSSITFRRFASNDVNTQEENAVKHETESATSAESEGQSSISSAINSAAESASSYASDAKDAISEYASEAAAATGFGSKPRNAGYTDLTPTNSIYIGNLQFDVTEADLRREFSEFGEVVSTTLATDPRGLSKGFGYVEFTDVSNATAAIEARNQTLLEGRKLIVNYQAKTKRPTVKNEPSKTLFIGNLAFEMSDADLNKLFRDIKNVIDVRVAIDRRTGQPRGFAHADFVDTESAVKALEFLQGKEIYGRSLRVDYSGVRAPRFGEGSSGGRGGDRPARGGYGGDRSERSDRGGYGGDRSDRSDRGGYGGSSRDSGY